MLVQESLDSWSVVEEQIKKNSYPRINWRAIFGMSLTRVVARFRACGLSPDLTFETLCFEHPEFSDEMKRRLKIGVCARFGEMGTAIKEHERVR